MTKNTNGSNSSKALKRYVERFDNLQVSIDAAKADQKEIMAEAKAEGFDVSALRAVIALRRKDPEALAEHEAMVNLYREIFGV